MVIFLYSFFMQSSITGDWSYLFFMFMLFESYVSHPECKSFCGYMLSKNKWLIVRNLAEHRDVCWTNLVYSVLKKSQSFFSVLLLNASAALCLIC